MEELASCPHKSVPPFLHSSAGATRPATAHPQPLRQVDGAMWPTSLRQAVRRGMCVFQAWLITCLTRFMPWHSLILSSWELERRWKPRMLWKLPAKDGREAVGLGPWNIAWSKCSNSSPEPQTALDCHGRKKFYGVQGTASWVFLLPKLL